MEKAQAQKDEAKLLVLAGRNGAESLVPSHKLSLSAVLGCVYIYILIWTYNEYTGVLSSNEKSWSLNGDP